MVTDQQHGSRLLRIDDVRRATEILLEAAAEKFGEVIDLDDQPGPLAWYWTLGADAAYAVVGARPDDHLTMGDLDDDLLEMAALVRRGQENEVVVLWHDLAHLCGLLGALSYLDLPLHN